ncbi:hypothetical protein CEXT_289611 [Caerostris extrusa]|uniref:Uncharacterized protein n=1 Tax=Caerostris extrusa TaxID=172846 RepID=A0AAV4N0R0_CAEEX|nr:hypothetical protein CEXT_289611 [Caerostris extrusa]
MKCLQITSFPEPQKRLFLFTTMPHHYHDSVSQAEIFNAKCLKQKAIPGTLSNLLPLQDRPLSPIRNNSFQLCSSRILPPQLTSASMTIDKRASISQSVERAFAIVR